MVFFLAKCVGDSIVYLAIIISFRGNPSLANVTKHGNLTARALADGLEKLKKLNLTGRHRQSLHLSDHSPSQPITTDTPEKGP